MQLSDLHQCLQSCSFVGLWREEAAMQAMATDTVRVSATHIGSKVLCLAWSYEYIIFEKKDLYLVHESTQFLCPRGKGHACGLCPALSPHSSRTEVTAAPCPMLCNSNSQRMAVFRFIPASTMPLAADCHVEKGCGRTIDKARAGSWR